MDKSRQLYSIGSQSHISMLDTRRTRLVHHFPSLDEGWGVRSLAHNQHILACGGGLGRLSFYDLKSMEYLEVNHSDSRWPIIPCIPSNQQNSSMSSILSNLRVEDTVMETISHVESHQRSKYHEATSTTGYLNQNAMYMQHFQGTEIKHALVRIDYDDYYQKISSLREYGIGTL